MPKYDLDVHFAPFNNHKLVVEAFEQIVGILANLKWQFYSSTNGDNVTSLDLVSHSGGLHSGSHVHGVTEQTVTRGSQANLYME